MITQSNFKFHTKNEHITKNRLHIWSVLVPGPYAYIRVYGPIAFVHRCVRFFFLGCFCSSSANGRFVSIISISVNPLQLLLYNRLRWDGTSFRCCKFERTYNYTYITELSYANVKKTSNNQWRVFFRVLWTQMAYSHSFICMCCYVFFSFAHIFLFVCDQQPHKL